MGELQGQVPASRISENREIQTVQNKACRYFLGGGKCASNVALRGDMGWNSCYVKYKTEVFRMWIKLRNVLAACDRLLKTVQTGRSIIHVVGKPEC